MPSRRVQAKRLHEEQLAREREAQASSARRRFAGLFAGGLLAAAAVAGLVIALTGGGEKEREAAEGSSVASIADVHGVGVDPADGALYIATHSGLFRSAAGQSSALRVEAPEQDLMGFSVAGPGRFLASGHPGPDQDLPPKLGLIESRDGGRSWRPLSLQGSADFHILRAAGETVYAFDGRLMRSRDGGERWDELEPPGEIADLALDPRRGDRVLASTSEGLKLSSDGGRSWSEGKLASPALLAWGPGARVFAVDAGGKVYASPDAGRSWTPVGAVEGPPAAVTADRRGTVYLARQDGSVDQSSDGGRTWRPRSRN